MKIEKEITVEIEVGDVEVSEKQDDEKYSDPKMMFFGYTPGDEVTIGGKEHMVSKVSFTQGFDEKPTEFHLTTESGLHLTGPIDDVVRVLQE